MIRTRSVVLYIVLSLVLLAFLGSVTASVTSRGQFILYSPTEDQIIELYEESSGDINLSRVVGTSTVIEMNYSEFWWKYSEILTVLDDLEIGYDKVR